MPKIAVRQGHGGTDPGAVSGRFVERDMNSVVALRVFNRLKAHGFECLYIVGPDVNTGIQQANTWKADLFVSVHHNAGRGDGYEVIHSIVGGKGLQLANILAEEFRAIGQNPHGQGVISKQGQNGDYYGEIRDTNMPAVITEFAYIDSNDVLIADTLDELNKEAEAIVKGVCRFYSVAYVSQPKPQNIPSKPQEEVYRVKVNGVQVIALKDKNKAIKEAESKFSIAKAGDRVWIEQKSDGKIIWSNTKTPAKEVFTQEEVSWLKKFISWFKK